MRAMRMAGLAVCCVATVMAGVASGEPGRPRLVATQQAGPGDWGASRFDEATGLWFSQAVDADGTPVSEVKGVELTLRKKVKRPGHVVIDLSASGESVSISVTRDRVDLKVGRRRLRFDPTRATEADYDAVRRVLAESRALSRLRIAASGVTAGTRKSSHGFDLLATEALLGLVAGDPSAAVQLKERIRAEIEGVQVQPVRRMIGECYRGWRQEVYSAMIDAETCVSSFAFWNVPMRNLCMLDWTIRVESAWFEYLSCSASQFIRIQ